MLFFYYYNFYITDKKKRNKLSIQLKKPSVERNTSISQALPNY